MPITATERARLGTVRPEILEALAALMDAAGAQLGLTLAVPDDGGTRSVQRQAELYADSLAQGGGVDTAYAVAQPGHSRHNYGAAFDVQIVAGGSNGDGTGSDGDYEQLATLGEALALTPGLTAGYFFAARGVGKIDPYHFQLNEPFQTSVDRWTAMQRSSTIVALGIIGVLAIGALALSRR
jgi:hypothetical protein